MDLTCGRIHILGVGNLGRLFAHTLATQSGSPPITLLLHRKSLLSEWEKAGRKVEITTDGVAASSRNYEVEVVEATPETEVENLIVTTKTINIVKAMESIKHRLTKHSTVLFTQNGMGAIDEVTRKVFPDIKTRPHYLAAITSHGVYSTGPFRSVHAGLANITIGQVPASPKPLPNPEPRKTPEAPPSQPLLDLIVQVPVLNARLVAPAELINLQLEKLVINAMINPLTAIFRCKNGDLFNRDPILRVMRLLLAEASQVLLSLPELQSSPGSAERFSSQRLEKIVLDVAGKTAKNTSSMLQDVEAGRKTEIMYINGYIVKRGKEYAVSCTNNEILVRLVNDEKVITVEEIEEYFIM